jgi:MFS-type transporter involved in bile tolerance (Atg22 family)
MEQRQLEFWLLGIAIALVMGGSQALSRSLFSQRTTPLRTGGTGC